MKFKQYIEFETEPGSSEDKRGIKPIIIASIILGLFISISACIFVGIKISATFDYYWTNKPQIEQKKE